MSDRPETLYHYTHPLHLVNIIQDQALWTTESNVSLFKERQGPDVVWAVDGSWFPEVGEDQLPHGLTEPKLRVRVEFRTEKLRAYRWSEWAWMKKMDDLSRTALVNAAGGWEAADRWWVVDHPVISRHWVEILADGDRIWPQ